MKRSRIVVLLVLAVTAALPAAAVKYVDKNNGGCNDLGPGTAPVPFCTIQRGYDQAAPGEQVRVLPGTYNECIFAFNLITPKNVEIVADAWLQNPPNNTVTVIDAGAATNCTFPGGGPASAINIAGAVRVAREMGPGHVIVTILCDYGTRYQSKLFNPAFLREKDLPTPAWLD